MEKVGWLRYDLERSGFDMTFACCFSSRLNQLTSFPGRLLAERLPVPGRFILSIWRERCINISFLAKSAKVMV